MSNGESSKHDSCENLSNDLSLIEVDDAFSYFQSLNLVPDPNWDSALTVKTRWKGLMSWVRTPPKLNADLKQENDLICCLAQSSFSWENRIHHRMIRTVYMKLTGKSLNCDKFGPHWSLIGFQGSDPSTDLRGVGILGLLQLLFLSTNSLIKPLAQKMYEVANSDSQPFPLAVLSLNVTQIAFNTLKSGKLVKECNDRYSVLQVLNLFYSAILEYFFKVWCLDHKTLKDSGYLLKDAEKYCCKNIRKVLLQLNSRLKFYNK